MRGGEDGGDHGGGGGLAVSAADGDAVFEAHEFGEHFGARNDGYFAFDHFGIVGFDGGGDHDYVRAFDVSCFVAFVNCRAQILQAFGDGGRLGVRAGDRVAESEKDFGDAAHADTADADQMYALKISERDHHEDSP